MKVMKLKMKCIEINDMKIKLPEIIYVVNQASRYIILKYLDQKDLLVIVFITTKMKYTKIIKNKLIYWSIYKTK